MTEAAARGDHSTLIQRVQFLSEFAGDIDVSPGPSFAFYQDRWSSDALVQLLTMAQRGMHITLMCMAWQQRDVYCSLPGDEAMIRGWCGQPEDWEMSREMLVSDGTTMRPWLMVDGRWWQMGLCRSYLEQIARRLKRQRAGFSRHKQYQGHVQQCSELLAALGVLPSPSPVPSPSPREKSAREEEPPPEVDAAEVTKAWKALVDGRTAAAEETNSEVSRMVLSQQRREHLQRLVADYGLPTLQRAFGALPRSDWHAGKNKHAGDAHLSFEAITRTDGRLNQVEVLADLAKAKRGSDGRMIADPRQAPYEDDDAHAIDG